MTKVRVRCVPYRRRGAVRGAALNSRVVIEQAKGIVTYRLDLDMDDAFNVLRRHSRDHNERLVGLAIAIVDRSFDTPALVS